MRWLKPKYIAEALGAFIVLSVFKALGIDRASAAGGALARRFGPRLGINKRVRRTLTRAFPDMQAPDIDKTLGDMWENLGRTFAEYAHLKKFSQDKHAHRVEIIAAPGLYDTMRARKQAIIFVSAHFANWEILPIPLLRPPLPSAATYRAQNNPYVDFWITRLRKRVLIPAQIPKGKSGVRALMHHVRQKDSIAMLVDQRLDKGVAAQFFGRRAMTINTPATLALRHGCLIVPAHSERLEGAHFRIHLHAPLDIKPTGAREADILRITQTINDFMEARIREHPAQWLWLHNRFKGED